MASLTNIVSSPKVRLRTKNNAALRRKKNNAATLKVLSLALNIPPDLAIEVMKMEPSAALALSKGTSDHGYLMRVLKKALEKVNSSHPLVNDSMSSNLDTANSKLDLPPTVLKKNSKEHPVNHRERFSEGYHSKQVVLPKPRHDDNKNIVPPIATTNSTMLISLTSSQFEILLRTEDKDSLARFLQPESGVSLTKSQKKEISKRLAILSCSNIKCDTKKNVLTMVTRRSHQAEFREQGLLYYGACVVSGVSIFSALEAAHIEQFSGNNDELENCLILRADLHNLFDAYEWTINPTTLRVEMTVNMAAEPTYRKFNGIKLKLYAKTEYLRVHYTEFQNKQKR